MQRSALCRSRRELSNEYLLAKIGVDTAENEPLKIADSAAWENTELVVSRILKADLVHRYRSSFVKCALGLYTLRGRVVVFPWGQAATRE